MDDCSLEKLSIKPGKLSPSFHRDTTEYHMILGSDVLEVTFDCITSDSGACYCISNSGGSKKVPLKEGEVNDVKIEVTAEDGTIKNYWVHIKRLSAKDATLSELTISSGTLDPKFCADTLEYTCMLPCDIQSLLVKPVAPDSKATIKVNEDKPETEIFLNLGATKVAVEVTSPDGSNKQNYSINVVRKQIPRYFRISDPAQAIKFECPISLATLYLPITLKGSDPKHTFSGPIIDELTKTSKLDPLNEMPLDSEWRIEDNEMDKDISLTLGCIPLVNGELSDVKKLGELGTVVRECSRIPKITVPDVKYETNVEVKHKLETRSWEKQLQQIFDESNPTKLVRFAEESLQKYYASLPQPGRRMQYDEGESPIDHLTHAAHCYATAIKNKNKDANLHLQLAMVLEERYYAEETLGIKKEESTDFPSLNLQAKESSKAEECAAICKLRGVSAGAPLALQLKAIDEEYHHLKESGQTAKSDHVQALFAWKSKQAVQGGATAAKASDDDSPLGQAFLKYMDALSLDESKASHHFHVGRLLVVQGSYEEAVPRIGAALGWNDQNQVAKLYLGLALALKPSGPGSRTSEAVGYLLEALEAVLCHNTELALSDNPDSERKSCLQADNTICRSNVYVLRGIIQLGHLLHTMSDVKECISAQDVFHTAALLASQVLTTLPRGDIFQQVEWVLMESHSALLNLLLKSQKDNTQLIAQRCERLSALIKRTTIPQNNELLALQKKTCETLTSIMPCSSTALYLLGSAQMAVYDNDPESTDAQQILQDAKKSFQACIGLEGKPAAGKAPEDLASQPWWVDKVKKEEEEQKAAKAKAQAAAGKGKSPAGVAGAATRGRGGATARGASTRGAPAAARGGTSRGGGAARGAAVSRGSPATRGGPARGGPVARGKVTATAKTPPAKPMGKAPTSSGSNHKCDVPDKRPVSAAKSEDQSSKPGGVQETNTPSSGPAPINRKSYLPRLGLARALAKDPEDQAESKKFYEEVIVMAPEVHDAYIESAETLTAKDPMAAVDIYSKFPVPEKPTFDDAYIFGEIVRLLMKGEHYDDPRLGPNMISMGKVMGLGCLEKYIQILDGKFKTKLLMSIYAGVNGKTVDDPDMQAFFKFKCWV